MKKISVLLFLVFCIVSCQKNSASNTADSYTITASSSGNGTISPSGTSNYSSGASATYLITPSSGFGIGSLKVDGIDVPFTKSYTQYRFDNITANHTISVVFSEYYTITTSVNDGLGSITPASASVPSGGSVSFSIVPNPGVKLQFLYLDGNVIPNTNTYVLNNITKSHVIKASFSDALSQKSLDSLNNLIIGKWHLTSFQARLMSSPTDNFFSWDNQAMYPCAASDFDTYSLAGVYQHNGSTSCYGQMMQFAPPYPSSWTLKNNGKVMYLNNSSVDSLTNITVTKDSLITYYYAGYPNSGHIGYHYHYVRTQ